MTLSAGKSGVGGPIVGGAATFTVTVPCAAVPPRLAVIVAVPAPTRTTAPSWLTAATLSSEDRNVK